MEVDIFADQADLYNLLDIVDLIDHLFPMSEVRFAGFKTEFSADDLGEMGILEHQRCLVKHRQGDILDYAVFLNVAEVGDLLHDLVFQRFVASEDKNARVNTHSLQLLNGVLGRL